MTAKSIPSFIERVAWTVLWKATHLLFFFSFHAGPFFLPLSTIDRHSIRSALRRAIDSRFMVSLRTRYPFRPRCCCIARLPRRAAVFYASGKRKLEDSFLELVEQKLQQQSSDDVRSSRFALGRSDRSVLDKRAVTDGWPNLDSLYGQA